MPKLICKSKIQPKKLQSYIITLTWFYGDGGSNRISCTDVLLFLSTEAEISCITIMFNTDSSAWLSMAGVFAPTLFSKAYGNLVCDACTNSTGGNSTSNSSGPFVCHNCHYDLVSVVNQEDLPNQSLISQKKTCKLTLNYVWFDFFLQNNGTLFHNHVE